MYREACLMSATKILVFTRARPLRKLRMPLVIKITPSEQAHHSIVGFFVQLFNMSAASGYQKIGLMSCRCQATAQLQCPKCKELCMPKHISVFCSQDCFKTAWAEHKKQHKPSLDSWMYVLESGRARAMNMPEFQWTGPLRPYRCATRTTRRQRHAYALVRVLRIKTFSVLCACCCLRTRLPTLVFPSTSNLKGLQARSLSRLTRTK